MARYDTSRARIYFELADYYEGDNFDSARYFNELAANIGSKLRDQKISNRSKFNKLSYLRLEKKWPDFDKCYLQILEEALNSDNKRLEAIAYSVKGSALYKQDSIQTAKEYYQKALKIRQSVKDTEDIIYSLNQLGMLCKQHSEYTAALDYYLRSLRLSELTKNENGIFACCINLGTIYEKTGDVQKAIELYKRAGSLPTTVNDDNGMAIVYYKLGMVNVKLNQLDTALSYYMKTLKLHRKLKSIQGIIKDFYNIGGLYSNQKKYDEALKNFNLSLEYCNKIADSASYPLTLSSMAKVYYELGDYKKAIALYKEAQYRVRNKNQLEYVGHLNARLSECYVKLGDYKNAYEAFVKYKAVNDSIYNNDNVKKQTELKLNYEFEKTQQQKELEVQARELKNKMELEQQKQQRNYLFVVIILVSGLLIISIRSYRSKQKANVKLEFQKKEVERQKLLIEQKSKEISDSISYARHIQKATLPDLTELEKRLHNYFILYKPKDVVSGDFYFYSCPEGSNRFYLAAADCTGHGVPGAIMSTVGSLLLEEIVLKNPNADTSFILRQLNIRVKQTLKQNTQHTNSRDGMDIAICCVDLDKRTMQFSGANRPCLVVSKDGALKELLPVKAAIGGFTENHQEFAQHNILLSEGDTMYIYTDGYADQFGGPRHKKLFSRTFKQLLVSNSYLSMSQQKDTLDRFFEDWKGHEEQIDDVLVIGFRI